MNAVQNIIVIMTLKRIIKIQQAPFELIFFSDDQFFKTA